MRRVRFIARPVDLERRIGWELGERAHNNVDPLPLVDPSGNEQAPAPGAILRRGRRELALVDAAVHDRRYARGRERVGGTPPDEIADETECCRGKVRQPSWHPTD